jgi:hypothetical protein
MKNNPTHPTCTSPKRLSEVLPRLMAMVLLFLGFIPLAEAIDFDPTKHITSFWVDKGSKRAGFKIMVLNDIDGADDDNLENARMQINETHYFDIICKDFNESSYSSSDIFFETDESQAEEKWGITLYAAQNLNFTLNQTGSSWWLDLSFDLHESDYFLPNYTLNYPWLFFEDAGEDYFYFNQANPYQVKTIPGWPPISINSFNASNSNCNQVALNWSVEGLKQDITYKIISDIEGSTPIELQNQTTQTVFINNPQPRDYQFTLKAYYGPYERQLVETGAVGGPPRTGYSNPSNFTATSHTCNRIELNWNNGGVGAAARKFYISWTDGGNTTIDKDATSFVISSGIENKTYNFRIQTENECGFRTGGITAASNPVALTAPSYLSVSPSYPNGPINLSWGASQGTEKYTIEKSTLDNTVLIENIENTVFNYSDTKTQGCVTYTYKVLAVNTCKPAGMATSGSSARITPDMSGTFSTTKRLNTSKGYFNDKVVLKWEYSLGQYVDRFKVYRREFPSGSFGVIETLEPTTTYTDITAEPGVYYEYLIRAESDCEADIILSPNNEYARDIGFCVPTGIVSGAVTFEGGAGVNGVQIIAETDDDFDGGGLQFNASNSKLTIPHVVAFDFSSNFTFTAWVKPTSTSQTTLFSKGTQYRVYHQENRVSFDANGQLLHLDFVQKPDSFFSINAVRDADSIYLYVLYDELTVFNTSAKLTTTTPANSSNIVIGADAGSFTGFIDEVRVWNRSFNRRSVINNSIRYISGNESQLKVYLRLDQHFNNRVFDISRTGSNFHENHATTVNCSFTLQVPTRRQLSVKGITDINGNYLITGIPYTVGSVYTFTPVFEVHEFVPNQKQLYIGPGSATHNNIDFVDVAAFRITGNIVYQDTYFPVAGVNFFIDGQIVVKADGTPILSDEFGNYEIYVPIGWHYFEVRKYGHTFVDKGRFPAEGNFNFQMHMSGVDFVNTTTIKLIGRVTGGSVEAEKKIGLGLTHNNIGHSHIRMTTQKGYDLTRTGISDSWEQMVYREGVSEVVGETSYQIAPLAPRIIDIYPDTETGEFVAYLLPEKYVISSITAGNYTYPESFQTILDLSNSHMMRTEIDSVLIDLAYDINGNKILYYRIDSVNYQHNHELIYRVTPSISVTNQEGEMAFWEKEIKVGEEIVPVVNSDGSLKTPHPLFVQRKPYHLEITVFERYINADENNEEDWVPVTDGLLEIQNGLAIQKDKFNLEIDSTGKALYSFAGGLPNITTGGIGDYLKSFNMVARTGPNKTINTPWLPNNGSPFYGYVLGGMPSGNNFVTTGPKEVVMILRDPPGSNSYSFMEKGTEFSITKSTEMDFGQTTSRNILVDLGSRVVTFAGLGAGVITETENHFDVNVGLEASTSYVDNTTTTSSISTTQKWQTSDDPYFNGTNGDVFIGYSTNIVYGVSTQINILPTNTGEGHIGEEFDHNGVSYDIGITKGLRMDTEFNTGFIFTQEHIKKFLMPNLRMIRNNFLINNPDVYQCVICDHDDELFGSDNNTGFKSELGYIGGDSYNVFIPADWPAGKLFEDSVAYFNKQIREWIGLLERNEKEKILAEPEKNISFDAGTIYESSVTTSSSTEDVSTFSFNVSPSVGTSIGFELMGMGTTVSMTQSFSFTRTTTTGETTTSSQTFGYVLADGDPGDYLSVDVMKPKSGTGPIFRTRGGQTSCPYEGATYTEYYQPGTLLNTATMQREKPRIDCENPIQNDVLEDQPAVYNVQMQNISETNDTAWFMLVVDDKSNQDGALVEMDGSSIGNGRLIYVMPGETVNKTVTIKKIKPDVFEYEDIKLVLTSQCDSLIYDVVALTARFQPACTPVALLTPGNQWIINTNGDTTMLANIGGYDLNHQSFQNISFQYKPASSPTWTTAMNYFMYEEDYNLAPHPKEMIQGRTNLLFDFEMHSMQDRNYDVRLRSNCADGTFNESVIASGIKDVKRPRVFGSPQPANGILTPNDDVMVTFDEPIQTGMLTPYNFSVRGVLNGQELKHQTCIYFDGATSYLTSLNGVNVNDKSFTISFWVRRGDNQSGVILAQNGLEIGFNNENKFYFKGGTQTITSLYSYSDIETWYHFAITFDADTNGYSMYVNDVIERDNIHKTSNFDSNGKMYLGRNVNGGNHFNGYLHELRVWEDYMGLGGVYALMYQSLTGNEIGLSGYWPMDEASGMVTEDRSRSNHAMFFNAEWRVFPSGYNREFNGVTDFVKINTGSSAVIDQDMNFTLEFFFKATPQQNTVLFSNGNAQGTDATPPMAHIWNIGFNQNGHLYVRNNGTSITLENLELTDDRWYHFALVVNRRANASVYIDGNMVAYRQASLFGGLVGADMVFGARRNQPGLSPSSVYYDRFYTGKIDEVRIWGLSKTIKQLHMDMHCALHGNEMGLMAYYPFDKYDQWATYRIPTLADLTDPKGERMAEAQGNASNVDVPNIKDARPVQNLTFDWVASTDKIIININEPPAAIERTIVEFTVDRVEDLRENRIASPVTWTAFIKQNTVIWDTEFITLEKELYAPLSFQVDIKNTGGTVENYTVSNLPAWLTCNEPTGTLAPLSSKTLTFIVNEALNTGRYEVSLYLTSDFGFNEKLELKIKVFKQAPNWAVNASNYQYSMNIIGQLFIDSIVSTDEDDIIAAFVGEECRGVVKMKYVMQQDNYLAFLDVYSNNEQGEPVHFKVWDASSGQIITNVLPSLVFRQNDIFGTPADPLQLYASLIYEGQIQLNKGWNWISFNLNSADLNNLPVLLKDVALQDNTIVKGQYGFDVYSTQADTWFGSLTANNGINNNYMYMLRAGQTDTLRYEGPKADVRQPIDLMQGWNWLGYTPQVALEIREAFASLNPVTGDFIKSQTEFAMFSQNLGWVGSLRMLRPGVGYMFRAINSGQFNYPENSIMSKSMQNEQEIIHPWVFDANGYEQNMSMVARLEGADIDATQNLVLGAFVNGQCRGVANPLFVDGSYLYFINIAGDNDFDDISFRLYHPQKQHQINASETTGFLINQIEGDLTNPFILGLIEEATHIDPADISGVELYPNPFAERLYINFAQPLAEEATVEITDMAGRLVYRYPSEQLTNSRQIIWEGASSAGAQVQTGVYFVKIKDSNTNTVIRVVKK